MPRYEYSCFRAKQRGEEAGSPEFCLFFAPAGQVLKWAAIQRIADQVGAIQRATNKAKVRGISRYFEKDGRNTIPTAVVVTLDVQDGNFRRVQCEGAQVHNVLAFEVADNITDAEKPGLVVDGQHRLLGMDDFDPELPIPVVALLSPDAQETAFQFLVINNKASKVARDHIRALALEYNEEGLELRLKTARLSLHKNYENVGQVDSEEGSPFRGWIDWPANRAGQKVVPPAAIEQSIQYIQDQGLQDLKDEDALLEFYYAIWNAVKSKWPALWVADSRLLWKVGIICMTKYLTDSLAKLYEFGTLDLTDPTSLAEMSNSLLDSQTPDFWTNPWKAGSYDNRIGQGLIVDDLVKITRNLRAGLPWNTDLKVQETTAAPE